MMDVRVCVKRLALKASGASSVVALTAPPSVRSSSKPSKMPIDSVISDRWDWSRGMSTFRVAQVTVVEGHHAHNQHQDCTGTAIQAPWELLQTVSTEAGCEEAQNASARLPGEQGESCVPVVERCELCPEGIEKGFAGVEKDREYAEGDGVVDPHPGHARLVDPGVAEQEASQRAARRKEHKQRAPTPIDCAHAVVEVGDADLHYRSREHSDEGYDADVPRGVALVVVVVLARDDKGTCHRLRSDQCKLRNRVAELDVGADRVDAGVNHAPVCDAREASGREASEGIIERLRELTAVCNVGHRLAEVRRLVAPRPVAVKHARRRQYEYIADMLAGD